MATEYRVYLDNEAATEEQLQLFLDITVDQAIGMASEAELRLDVGMDNDGLWTGLEEDFAKVFSRIRVEVKVDEGEFVGLIDGPIVEQRFELGAGPGESNMVIVVQDDSVLMNQYEAVELYEDRSPDDIASGLFSENGLIPDTDPVDVPAGGLTRYLVRRSTAMQFLKELARRHGFFVYVIPDDTPGTSRGIFKRPQLESGDFPELLLKGKERNIAKFSAQFDALRPLKARADNVDITDQTLLSKEVDSSDLDAQGDDAVHDLLEPGLALLARTREALTDLEAAATAGVNHSSWAYTAKTEVQANSYSAVLSPYKLISVAGVGGHLAGDWLINQVTHNLDNTGYRQQISLCRNARSTGSSGGGDGLLDGVF